MKLGFVSAILDGYSYEEMMATAKEIGYQCVEVACWPEAKAERRYAGVSHINCEKVIEDDSYAQHVLAVAKDNDVEISSLAFYPNTLDPDQKKRHDNVEHLKNVIRASHKLGINMVTTFIGRDQNRNFEDNLLIVKEVWPEILNLAKELGVKVAIENCPMLFGPDQWPGGQNLMTTPHNWRRIFEILDYDNLGINYDPSHFVWQMIDYVEPVYEFRDRIFHVHFKDLKVIKSKLNQVGILAYPLDFMAPKLPGLGDVNFSRFVSALTDIGYNSYACVEVEDRAFEDTKERILDSLKLSYHYMRNFVI
ncbi:sugar phosphate isomerase/epimerase family protein [Succinivibrio dextrinosolvens]|uniref:Sugar phosphate isomerase/epimerase n=1 Tax=Succinivibrio dextrinosolvens TaxID=83771 RepID=A0A662ZAY6_9GAMM|nr:sugar phosphate isomerase/epimerase [Succinivibrio dextrinosolvens]SFK26613.1 Sugar phosphate isomerase/epimerase [Succinivibrio dextrinosolvens]